MIQPLQNNIAIVWDKNVPTGISFVGVLAILSIGLKLTNYINWSWWWVLSPLWGPFAIVLIVFIVYVIAKIVINK